MLFQIFLPLLALAAPQDVPAPALLASVCTTQGAFGERFGETKTIGKARAETNYNLYLTPAKPVPGLSDYDASVTVDGRKLFRFGASRHYGSPAASAAALESVADAIEARGGWTRVPVTDSEDEAYREPHVEFRSDARQGGVQTEFSLYTLSGLLVLDCIDISGREAAMEQAFGPGTHSATPPQPPAIPRIPPIPPLADCAIAARRDAILAGRDDMRDQFSRFGRSGPDYANRLADWRAEELVRRGVWTEARRKDFGYELLEDPAFRAAYERSMTLISVLIDHGMTLSDAERRGDRAGQCRATIRLMITFRDIAVSAQAQWDVVDARFKREAERLGVTF